MGQLIEGTIANLFGGVSRQPPQVRRTNEVEEAKNTLLSVATGGFEKRPNTQFVADLTFLDSTKEYSVHGIDRSETEQDFILFDPATPAIFAVNALTGAQKTVTIGDTKHYFLVERDGINSVEIIDDDDGVDIEVKVAADAAETTFDWGFQLSDAATVFKIEGSADGAVWNDLATTKTGASGTFSTTVDAVVAGDHNFVRFTTTTGAGASTDTITIWATFKDMTYLINADPEDLKMVSVADFTFVANRNVLTGLAESESGTVTSTVQTFSDLPAATGTGNIHRVRGRDTDGFGTYYVKDNGTGDYIEVVDPTAHNTLDPSSMPHQLVRASDGATYTFQAASWDTRPAGDELLNPAPGFINSAVADVAFYKNRIVLVSEETVYLSQSGDVFNMWAAKATDVLDSDPIERGATTTDVNLLQFASTFRKLLFMTSPRAQFEMESGTNPLTPETAILSQATTYRSSIIAKPVDMGDVLHFAAKTEGAAVVYEYFFQDVSLSNTAADITRSIRGYIDNDIFHMASDPTSTTLFLMTTAAQNKLYIYRTFFDQQKKVQSSWAEYIFGAAEANAFIHGFTVFSNFVVMVIERDDGNIYIEQFPIEREALVTNMPFMPLVDQRDELTGTYNSTHDVTHWDTAWVHSDDAEVVLGPSGVIPGRTLITAYPDKYVMTLATVAATETLVIGGKTFTAHATTTTTANREFDISGTDSADGDELVTVLNDATDGIGDVFVASNAAGVVTIRPLDTFDNTAMTAPTGTAIDNATVVSVLINDLVAAKGDHSVADAYVGRAYTMTGELSKIYAREGTDDGSPGTPVVTGRLQLKDITVLYEKTGYFELKITPDGGRPAKSYKFEGKTLGDSATAIDSPSVAAFGAFGHKKIMSKADTVKIEFINDKPEPCVITSAQWRGFFNEVGRSSK